MRHAVCKEGAAMHVEGYEMGIERLKWIKAAKGTRGTARTEAHLNKGITILRPTKNDRHEASRGRDGNFISLLACVHSWCVARRIRCWYNIHRLFSGSFHPYKPYYQIKTSVNFTSQIAAICCCYVVTHAQSHLSSASVRTTQRTNQVWRHWLGCDSHHQH